MPNDGLIPEVLPPFRLRAGGLAVPAGWPPDVRPNELIASAHINAIRSSVYAWPGDVDGQNHILSNVHLVNATGVLVDPTTTQGDLIARGPLTIDRFPIGTQGQVLMVDTTRPELMKWTALPPAGVSSVFGRAGAILAQTGDYTVAQITGAMADPTTTKGDLIARSATAAGRLPIGANGQVLQADSAAALGVSWGAPAVSSVFGRTGIIAPQTGDYTAMMVTNAVSTQGSYPDPPWIPNYSYSRLIGVPTAFPPAPHTHDAAAIVSGVIATARLGTGVADATVYLRGDGTWAAAGTGGGGGVISVFGRAGNVIAQSGDYTAAMVTGAVTDPTTQPGDLIVRSNLNTLVRMPVGADGQVLQTDTTLATRMKWTTITGAVQTPWVTDVNAANFQLVNVRRVGVGLMAPNYPMDVVGDINYTGVLRVNGVPVTFGGSQTPWTQDINAAGFSLNNAKSIGIGVTPPQSAPLQVASHTPGSTGSIAVQDLDATASGNPVLLVSGISSEGTRCWALGNRGGATFAQDFYVWNDRASATLFGTNSAERMRITPAGSVGIGNAGVPPFATTNQVVLTVGSITGVGPGWVTCANNTATVGAGIGQLNFANHAITASDKRIAAVIVQTDTTIDGGNLQFYTASAGVLAERMRITAAGNVGINQPNPTLPLDVAGKAQIVSALTGTFDCTLIVGNNNAAAAVAAGILRVSAMNAASNNVLITAINSTGTVFEAAANGRIYMLGTVGIKTAAPLAALDVIVPSSAYDASASGASGVRFGLGTAVTDDALMFGVHTGDYCWIQAVKPGTAGRNLILNPIGGNVGIGYNTPAVPLSFGAALGNKIALWDGGAAFYGFGMQSGLMQIYCNTSTDRVGIGYGTSTTFNEVLSVRNTGIGIGTTNIPSAVTAVGGNGQIRIVAGNYGAIFYNNTTDLYFLITNSGDSYGNWNALRPFAFNFASGNVVMSHAVSVGNGLTVGGNCNITGQYQVNGVPITGSITVQVMDATVGTRPIINFRNNVGITAYATDDAAGNRVGVSFAATSDMRIKQNIVDLSGGLAIIERLRPVAFEYNGACGFAAGERSASIIAQELQEVLPDCVYSIRSKLQSEDTDEIDLLCFDPNQLLAHVILAVKQLGERLKALEGKVN
jgi:hypothetical protein